MCRGLEVWTVVIALRGVLIGTSPLGDMLATSDKEARVHEAWRRAHRPSAAVGGGGRRAHAAVRGRPGARLAHEFLLYHVSSTVDREVQYGGIVVRVQHYM